MKNAVLCIERTALHRQNIRESGIHDFDITQTTPDDYHFINRKIVDSVDEVHHQICVAFPQILGYVVIRSEGQVLTYSRKTGAETRLHGSRSLGFGGHADIDDVKLANGFIAAPQTLSLSIKRELEEELDYTLNQSIKYDKLILDNQNAVGRVHVGLLQIIDLPINLAIKLFQEEISDPDWVTLEDLQKTKDQYENWSQMVIEHLVSNNH